MGWLMAAILLALLILYADHSRRITLALAAEKNQSSKLLTALEQANARYDELQKKIRDKAAQPESKPKVRRARNWDEYRNLAERSGE